MWSDVKTAAQILLAIAVTVPLALLWIVVAVDLVRRTDLSVVRKLIWATIVVLTLHIGLLIYFVFRPVPPPAGKRRINHAEHSSRIVSQLETLHAEHLNGEITDDAYLTAKQELLGVTT